MPPKRISPTIAGSADVGIFHVIDEMVLRGWYVQPQLRRGPSPENMHLTLCPTNAKWVEEFLRDLATSVEASRGKAPSPLAAQMAETFAGMDAAIVPDEVVESMMAVAGAGEGGKLPERQAELNEILNAAPPGLVERAAIAFFNGAFRSPS